MVRPSDTGNLQAINSVTRHGFTWQTALGSMGLNDMNGRIQDAVTGRFLSPDPTVPNPGFTQSFNRYSYVNNNPLTYIDPSGFAGEAPPPAKHQDPQSGQSGPSGQPDQSQQSDPTTVEVQGSRGSDISPTFAGPTLGSGTGAENGNGYAPGMTTDPKAVATVTVSTRRITVPGLPNRNSVYTITVIYNPADGKQWYVIKVGNGYSIDVDKIKAGDAGTALATLQQAITQDSDQLSSATENRVSISSEGDVNAGAPPNVSMPVEASHLDEPAHAPEPALAPARSGEVDAPLPDFVIKTE